MAEAGGGGPLSPEARDSRVVPPAQETEGLRYGNPGDFLVSDQATFDAWTAAYSKARESADRFQKAEVAKRQWLPKALEVVSQGPALTAT